MQKEQNIQQVLNMQSQKTYITKAFQLTNDLNASISSYVVKLSYIPSTREINMSEGISNICSQGTSSHPSGVSLLNCHIFYMDFNRKLWVHLGMFPFQQQVYLKYELFLDGSIKLRYRKMVDSSCKKEENKTAPKQRSKKTKQRTIKEALDYVKKWRNLYQLVDNCGKRIHTLESAAKEVGLAKKTLDDYYYQFRQAQYFGFNIEAHKDAKIGIMRKYIKKCIKEDQMMKEESQQKIAEEDDIDKYLQSFSEDSQEERK